MQGIGPLLEMVVPWMLVVTRVAGLFIFAPMVSSVTLPFKARALVAATIGLAATPLVIGTSPGGQVVGPIDLVSLPWLMLSEMMIGLSMGLIAVLPLLALDLAGVLMGHQMGLNLARVYNPESDAEIDALGQTLFFVGFAAYIAAGGVESLFITLLSTFERVPVGSFGVHGLPTQTLVGVLMGGLELAVRVAAPVWGVVAALLVVVGLLGKFLPQINTMTIGFMLKILVGIGVLAISMNVIGEVSGEFIRETLDVVARWAASV
jgi:flagellar biosynthetic protein FliR